jgi:hypothetical protein
MQVQLTTTRTASRQVTTWESGAAMASRLFWCCSWSPCGECRGSSDHPPHSRSIVPPFSRTADAGVLRCSMIYFVRSAALLFDGGAHLDIDRVWHALYNQILLKRPLIFLALKSMNGCVALSRLPLPPPRCGNSAASSLRGPWMCVVGYNSWLLGPSTHTPPRCA